MGEVLISLIVPTRGRPEEMLSFLESVRAHASAPQNIEVVMIVDEDDSASQAITFEGLSLVRVLVPPGLTMGALNMAGYRASRGNYIMLTNDDVRVRTAGWDDKALAIFRSFNDEIVLVHVNDMTFGETLCIFPFVSRKFCEFAAGICSEEYIRYRIDDHIYNVFNLLSLLGHNRIVYLPDVVFAHQNVTTNFVGKTEYVPNPEIHAKDTAIFDGKLPSRKKLAVRLAAWIDTIRRGELDETRRKILAPYTDSVSLRRKEFIRVMPEGRPAADARITIGVVSANFESEHARTCLDRLKKHTRNFDLVLLDNNRGPDFNHPREMNRLLDICRTDFLVLMDDDVWVTPGWLESMLSCVNPEVGVVTPLHLDREGKLSYAGIVMNPDDSGNHSHIYKRPKAATPSQTLCSAVMLIDITKVGHLRFDESYSKYFMDIDYGLRVWEAGFKVIVDPNSKCTHLAGATLAQGSSLSNELYEIQRRHWTREWIDTRRFECLRENVWQLIPEFREVLEFPATLAKFMIRKPGESPEAFLDRAKPRVAIVTNIPVLQRYLREKVELACNNTWVSIHDDKLGHLMLLNGLGLGLIKAVEGEIEAAEGEIEAVEGEDRTLILKEAWSPWTGILQFAPPGVEREIGKLLCTLGFARVGSLLWNSAQRRAVLRISQKTLEYPNKKLGKLVSRGSATTSSAATAPAARRNLTEKSLFSRGENASAVALVDPDRSGFAVYLYEHQYFCIPAAQLAEIGGTLNAEQCQTAVVPHMLVAHSLAEADELIAHAKREGNDDGICLVFSTLPLDRVRAMLRGVGIDSQQCDFLTAAKARDPDVRVHECGDSNLLKWARKNSALPATLRGKPISKVVVPWSFPESWTCSSVEAAAAKACGRVQIITAPGVSRTYIGENLHRLIYNKSYLSSMFQCVPSPAGKDVLEIGCSDGLVCDILSACGARRVRGIDVMKTTGRGFRSDNIEYLVMDGARTDFADESFDIVYSIATMEHVPDPAAVLAEILRVTRRGGYAYIQAGPLYHSPFGHHMFAYFANYPWIHLLNSTDEIIDLAKHDGVASRIERDLACPAEDYIRGMLTREHVNGLFLEEYGLEKFKARPDVEVLKFNVSYEGEDKITPAVLNALAPLERSHLTEHGFELAFRRR